MPPREGSRARPRPTCSTTTPATHRRRIRTNNMIERLNREIRRRTRVVGSFPDAQRVDAHLRESPLRNFQRVVDATLPRHVKVGENVQSAN